MGELSLEEVFAGECFHSSFIAPEIDDSPFVEEEELNSNVVLGVHFLLALVVQSKIPLLEHHCLAEFLLVERHALFIS